METADVIAHLRGTVCDICKQAANELERMAQDAEPTMAEDIHNMRLYAPKQFKELVELSGALMAGGQIVSSGEIPRYKRALVINEPMA